MVFHFFENIKNFVKNNTELKDKLSYKDWKEIIDVLNKLSILDDNFRFLVFRFRNEYFELEDEDTFDQNICNYHIKYADISKKDEFDVQYKLSSEKYNFNCEKLEYNMHIHAEYHGY